MEHPHATLRDRRRTETAFHIQFVTLDLIRKHGLANVSSEMIAAEAGISKRTFFNYYTNKEAAAVGPASGFEETALAAFAAAKGRLTDDIADLLRDLLQSRPAQKETIRAIDEVLIHSPSLLPAFRASMNIITDQMTALLTARLGPAQEKTAAATAELVGIVLIQALQLWAHDDGMKLEDAMRFLTGQLEAIGGLLAPKA
ncbi:MAG: hypothetical protein DI533_05750 [Cereibacter sphaeroides]|uniref:HTH tetR-type domain-containing protein n=1 Tax=Cereibacter sphaeroides TaxID=1063 RepID=A0A2W5SE56_CERSP|nr:MAG: hypothetical protein DI533_05750 [Cereibacter sphaeroides]